MKKVALVDCLAISPLIVFTWQVFHNQLLYSSDAYDNTYPIYQVLILMLLGIVFIRKVAYGEIISLSVIDLVFFGYILIAVFSNGLRVFSRLNEGTNGFIFICLFYVLCKLSYRPDISDKIFVVVLIFILLIELYVCLKQFLDFGIFSSESSLSITGTLGNSGIVSFFCTVIIVGFVALVREYQQKLKFSIALVLLLVGILSCMLAVTRSRGAVISASVGLLVIFVPKNTQTRLKLNLWKTLAIVFGISVTILLAVFFKINSALGRLLIWKVTLPHIAKNPFFGIGYGEFPHVYSFWQADYFQTQHLAILKEDVVSDFPFFTFNEPLQIILETGIIGLSLFSILNYLLLFGQTNLPKHYSKFCRLIIVAILVFSLFSYPLHSFPIISLYIIIAATLAANENTILDAKISKWSHKIAIATLALASMSGLIYRALETNQAVAKWNEANLSSGKINSKFLLYDQAYPLLRSNSLFLFQYGSQLFQENKLREAVKVLEEGKLNMADIQNVIYLGKAYWQLGNVEKAEENFRLAEKIMPLKLEPKFLLLNLSIQKDNAVEARTYTETILKMNIKVPSPEVDLILDSVRRIKEINRW